MVGVVTRFLFPGHPLVKSPGLNRLPGLMERWYKDVQSSVEPRYSHRAFRCSTRVLRRGCDPYATCPSCVYFVCTMLGFGKVFLRIAVLAHVVQCFVPRVQNVHHRPHESIMWAHRNDPPGQESDPLALRSRTREACWPPFIGVLRGIEVARSIDVALMLHNAGFRVVSVTVDTPEFERILRDLSSRSDLNAVVFGASSVTSPAQVINQHAKITRG